MNSNDRIGDRRAPLLGLVLAGGDSTRMGRDKGSLDYRGRPLVVRAWRALDAVCESAYVSVRDAQTTMPAYAGLPLIVDRGDDRGPVIGLLAAWAEHPSAAWLLLAADMPLVDEDLLGALIGARDGSRPATMFVHPDGTPEPLCAIYEPAARAVLAGRAAAGTRSLRAFLDAAKPRAVALTGADRLINVNTAAELGRLEAGGGE
jgi:molybdopterin-guanine dinucleotide biosynthesis protein A